MKLFPLLLFCLSMLPNISFGQNGCKDPLAINYNSNAFNNDGSCKYPGTTAQIRSIVKFSTALAETSGLLWHNNQLWTHNDSGGEATLYAVDTVSGEILRSVIISDAAAVDWEDICKDDTYLYIGDIGNNDGSRTNLCLYRVLLEDLNHDTASAEKISFFYPDQTDFSSQNQNHNFDAEALIAMGDSLYIFSKNWKNLKCKVYALPKTPGNYPARLIEEYNTGTLITGADFSPEDNLVVLTAYNKLLDPSLFMLWDFNGRDVFSGNKRKLELNQAFHQFEAICLSNDRRKFLLSNEALGSVPSRLFSLDVNRWLSTVPTFTLTQYAPAGMQLFPNPAKNILNIQWNPAAIQVQMLSITDYSGREIIREQLPVGQSKYQLLLQALPVGIYFVLLQEDTASWSMKFVKE